LTETLKEQGIGLQSLQESITTTSSSGQLIFHLFGALAEFERNLVRERTQAGLTAARARGRKGGRPKVLDPAKRQLAVKLYHERQITIDEICRMIPLLSLSQNRNLKHLLYGQYRHLTLLSFSVVLNQLKSLLSEHFSYFGFPSLTEEG
jgi:DNA invertase Pin-like site-specific DNA recombinase